MILGKFSPKGLRDHEPIFLEANFPGYQLFTYLQVYNIFVMLFWFVKYPQSTKEGMKRKYNVKTNLENTG
jgi:hypothetical protein